MRPRLESRSCFFSIGSAFPSIMSVYEHAKPITTGAVRVAESSPPTTRTEHVGSLQTADDPADLSPCAIDSSKRTPACTLLEYASCRLSILRNSARERTRHRRVFNVGLSRMEEVPWRET